MLTMNTAQALALLSKLRQAAPPPAASRLADVAALVERLAQENAYLNALVNENTGLLAGAPAPAPAALPAGGSAMALDLLAGLANALRTSLADLRARAELVQASPLTLSDNELSGWLAVVHSSADYAFRLLDTVQQIIALEQERIKLNPINFVTTELIEEARRRAADVIAARCHHLTVIAPDVVPLATGDFHYTQVVLSDLLDNAARYTPEGGALRLSVESLGTHVLFSVADNGLGLSAEDLAYVGRPFWRADRHLLVRQHAGTGLRLFLAKQVLARQAGELIFYGEPGVGSTFSFTLPSPG